MSRPVFTHEEEYLIHHVKTSSLNSSVMFEFAYLFPSFALIAMGFFTNEKELFFAAFFLIAAFRIWDIFNNRKYFPFWKSIIEKYEEALEVAEKPSGAL